MPPHLERRGLRVDARRVSSAVESEEEEDGPSKADVLVDGVRVTAGAVKSFIAEHRDWWLQEVGKCELKPNAAALLKELKKFWLDDPLGTNAGAKDGRKIYNTTLSCKLKHPRKVALVRVGEFYESAGYDAILLMQHCGLNRMGQTMKAGAPVSNLRQTLDALLAAGWSIAILEELPTEALRGKKKGNIQRYLAGVVTPSLPEYNYNGVRGDCGEGTPSSGLAAVMTAGLAYRAGGFELAQLNCELRNYTLLKNLPEAVVVARLRASPSATLYVHESVKQLPFFCHAARADGLNRHLGSSVAGAIDRRGGITMDIKGDLVTELLKNVEGQDFLLVDPTLTEDSPAPLSVSAAASLGVLFDSSMPSLVGALLPSSAPLVLTEMLAAMLLSPPPGRVARDMLDVLHRLSTCLVALPVAPLLRPGKLSRQVTQSEASASLLNDIDTICGAIQTLWAEPTLRPIGEKLLQLAEIGVGVRLRDREMLTASCADASAVIRSMVATSLGDSPTPAYAQIPLEMLEGNEKFRGRVLRSVVEGEYAAAENAAQTLDQAILSDLMPAVRELGLELKYDTTNNTVYLVCDKKKLDKRKKANAAESSADPERQTELGQKHDSMIAPLDRKGSKIESKSKSQNVSILTTPAVEAAVKGYCDAAAAAERVVTQKLRECSQQLVPHLLPVLVAAELLLYLALAQEHAGEARRKGWVLPELQEEGGAWRMVGVTPFWLSRNGATTVKNDLELDGMLLLTGPNMSGKSTIARSAGAVALLANCGLFVPATQALVPRFNAFHVRMASEDAPREGLSHWGRDMRDLASLVKEGCVSPATCVMLDEVCQGTEVLHGTAMAGSLLVELCNANVRGIFSTHLHGILDLSLPEQLRRMRMAVGADEDGVRRPTWLLEPGQSTESLAFEVASDCGMSDQLVKRAKEMLALLAPGGSTLTSVVAKPGASPREVTLLDASPLLEREATNLLNDVADTATLILVKDAKRCSTPGPWAAGKSAVYLLRIVEGGFVSFYVGETDDLIKRLTNHSQTYRKALLVEAAYIMVQDKTLARKVEAATITSLRSAGFNLRNKASN